MSKSRLLTPGPTPIPEEVRLAMAQPMIHHRKPQFKKILADCQDMLRQLFGTSGEVLPLSCSGTGAMTAAIHGLFLPGEKVLVAEGGKFGERWGQIAKTYGLEVQNLSVPWGQAILPGAVEAILNTQPDIKGVLIQISETSTGVQHPVDEIARITRQRDVLLVADGISAVGLSPVPMDTLGIDCLLTGSQKGLMLPPGLAFLACSKRAWAKAEKVPPTCYYFNILKERENCQKNQTLFTSPVGLLVGLQEALRLLLEHGQDTIYRKQWGLTQMARTGVQALGLKLFAPQYYTWGLTTVHMPAWASASKVVKLAEESCGVLLTTGQEPMKEEMVRLAHMGWVDWADLCAGIHALALALKMIADEAGQPALFQPQKDALEQALAAWHRYSKGEAGKL